MMTPEQLYAQLVDAFRQARWHDALIVAERLLPDAPNHPGVYSMAGIACMELQQLRPAVDYLRCASELDPTRADFATLLAKAFSMAGSHREALDAVDRALFLNPVDPMALDTLGMICIRAQAHAKAAAAFRRAVALAPDNAQCRFNLATALVGLGDLDAAEAEFEECVTLAPTYWHPHLSLAQLRRQTPERNHLHRLLPLLSQSAKDIDARAHLHMALAKEYEDLAEYPAAFDHLAQAKTAARHRLHYASTEDERLFELVMRSFPEAQPTSVGDTCGEPIFVVGMPRSGTTLVERILSSHPDVHGAGELQNFAEAVQRVSGHRGSFIADPSAMATLHNLDWKQLGADYIASTRPTTGHTPRFVDKLPHNFLFIGFIARALPNARIVCLRRDPIDTCLSNFRQLFEADSPHFGYSFDLLDTGRYYLLFDRLMKHWKKVVPGRVFEVSYESLIESQGPTTRDLLEFCGLPWRDACMHFEQNAAPVGTRSATQVRSPIYSSAVGRWKRYAPQLKPLLDLIGSADAVTDRTR